MKTHSIAVKQFWFPNSSTRSCGWILAIAALIGAFSLVNTGHADEGGLESLFPNFGNRSLVLGKSAARPARHTKWSANYRVNADGQTGVLNVAVKIFEPYHIGSVSQPEGGPRPTVLKLDKPVGVSLAGDFVPDQAPLKSETQIYQVVTEEHVGDVVWTAPIKLSPDFGGELNVSVNSLACESVHGSCTMISKTLVAKRVGPQTATNAQTKLPTASSNVTDRLAGLGALGAESAGALGRSGLGSNGLGSFAEGFGFQGVSSGMTNQLVADTDDDDAGSVVGKPFRDGDYVVQWQAQLEPASVAPGGRAVLKFVAKPDAEFHVYRSVTDDSKSSTNFVVTQKSGLKIGAPQDAKPPITKSLAPGTEPIHYYQGTATWSLPIEIPADAPAGKKMIVGQIAYQACTDSACYRPMALKFTAVLEVGKDGKAVGEVKMVPAKYSATLELASETQWVDDQVKLATQASVVRDGHHESVAQHQVASPELGDAPSPIRQPASKPADAVAALAFDPPGPPGGESASLHADTPGEQASDTTTEGFDLSKLQVDSGEQRSAVVVLPLAFVAGFLLNFMPCVLPVVGLKLLSFVQQANSDRKQIFLMNLAYTGGLLSVMLVLATLAVFAGLGWGEQFSSTKFTVTLAAIVFAFGLSFLGVWEIPLPGFVGDADSNSQQEGYGGAFTKGILSTLLATPCSGPFLGAALAWAVTQSGLVTYSVFIMVGLGMASPYLVIGMFPSLIRFLPKPGNWMVLFKQIMGFVMLGTVVYLMSFMPVSAVVPCTLLLLGVGVAVWMAAQTPLYAPASKQVRAWTLAGGLIAITALFSFGWLRGVMQYRFEAAAQRWIESRRPDTSVQLVSSSHDEDEIAWQTFSSDRLQRAVSEGKPVFVDFTADWCMTCKANEAAAIETPEVAKAIRQGEIIAMRADKTEPNPEADQLLRQLGNAAASIPFYAFFPVDGPDKPIVMDGLYANSTPFLEAISETLGSRRE